MDAARDEARRAASLGEVPVGVKDDISDMKPAN